MDEILGGLRQEGRLDSQGEFTLALEEAMRKLGERQFELPGLYLLKLIQASVALGASGMELKIGTASVSFEARLDHVPSGVEAIVRGPFQDFASDGLRHLAWAWTALAAVRPESAALEVGDHRFVLDQQGVSLSQSPRVGVRLRLKKAKVRWWQRLVPGRTAEHAMVCRAAGYCPVPLKVDGRWIDGSEPRLGEWQRGKLKIVTTAFWQPITCDYDIGHQLVFRPGGGLSARPPLLVGSGSVLFEDCEIDTVGTNFPGHPVVYAWKWPEPLEPIEVRGNYGEAHRQLAGSYLLGFHSGLDRAGYYDLERMAFLALPAGQAEPYLSSGERRLGVSLPLMGSGVMLNPYFRLPSHQRVPVCWAHVWLPADQPAGTGWLYPCQHGVLLDPVLMDLAGAVVVVTADGCETDLSQLRVVENDLWKAIVAEVRSCVAAFRSRVAGSKGLGLLAEIDYLVMSHVQKKLT